MIFFGFFFSFYAILQLHLEFLEQNQKIRENPISKPDKSLKVSSMASGNTSHYDDYNEIQHMNDDRIFFGDNGFDVRKTTMRTKNSQSTRARGNMKNRYHPRRAENGYSSETFPASSFRPKPSAGYMSDDSAYNHTDESGYSSVRGSRGPRRAMPSKSSVGLYSDLDSFSAPSGPRSVDEADEKRDIS